MLRRRLVAASCLLAGLIAVVSAKVWLGTHSASPQSAARIGHNLPALPVVDASGKTVDLSKLAAGEKTVIAFYSPTCHVCEQELPELLPFPKALRLVMVSESGDLKAETAQAMGLPAAGVFYDANGVLSRSFAMAGLPTILLVDERGVLRDGLVGAHARALVQRKLAAFATTRS